MKQRKGAQALVISCAVIATMWIPIASAFGSMVLPPSGMALAQGVKLTAGDAAAGDQFGTVAISGDTIVVGAQLDDDAGNGSGSAYVFVKDGDIWTQQQKLTAADAAVFDLFGISVAISGDTIVVGAVFGDDACPGNPDCNSGAVYVFVRDGGAWTQQQKLTASDANADDRFGNVVAISGDTIVVGARFDDDAGSNSGSAYVFTRQGNLWTQRQKLTAADAAAGDEFGNSIAISGDRIVIGASRNDDACPSTINCDSGSAYVFVRQGGVWTQQQKLTAADAAVSDLFGASVAISGDTIVVGASGDDDAGNQSGSAYVFVRDGGAWTEQQKLVAVDGKAGDLFGEPIAISGDTIVGGASGDDNACPGDPNCDSGAAHVFVRDGDAWIELPKLIAMEASAGDGFGFPVALGGERVVAGSMGDDDRGSNSGAAYIFRLDANCAVDPLHARQPLGGEYAVAATVFSSGQPASGISVDLDVISGPNTGLTRTGITDSSGQVNFSYRGNNMPGVDTIEISGSVEGNAFSCAATVEWTDGPIITTVKERKGNTGRNITVKGFNFQRGDMVLINDQEVQKTKFKNSGKLVAKKAMDLVRPCPGGVPVPNEIKVISTTGRKDTFALATCP